MISPIGFDKKFETYNINADTAAGALARSVRSRRLMLMTDVEGVYDKNKKLISEIKSAEAENSTVALVGNVSIPDVSNDKTETFTINVWALPVPAP